jgi:nicotinate phosphoribosyltransferase
LAARASFVAGATATSLVEAGRRYGIPLSGTMAHSYVQAHGSEHEAFVAFLRRYASDAVLLIDTYDTAEGARTAVAAMRDLGVVASGVRIDSGDLRVDSEEVRGILDGAGYPQVRIVVSGDLDEVRIADLVAAAAPIDAFGVGTRMGTSDDAPHLGVVYKLVESGGTARHKTSPGKATLPGRKQAWRVADHDVLALADEPGPDRARPLLTPVWRDGRRVGPPSNLSEIRARTAASLADWTGRPRPVELSPALAALAQGIDHPVA